ncbi:MAG: hypothetical protein QOG53_3624 [Frankiales bacterium]|jgi:glucose/arabinose dehydrogenase|nr:hypothetical protein [Frankiales bacterium]
MRTVRVLIAAALVALLASSAAANPYGTARTPRPTVPIGFAVSTATVVDAPTSLAFAPDGRTLYVATAISEVWAFPVIAGGRALGAPRVFLGNLDQPLGVLATSQGVFVSEHMTDSDPALGQVLRAVDRDGNGKADSVTTVLSHLPVGIHATNGLALGRDGMLYIANGSSNYTGFGAEGGPPMTRPYSGSILRVPPSASNLRPTPSMVVATGFRNPYDIAFFPRNHPAVNPGQDLAAVTMNGPDGGTYDGHYRPLGEDTLSVFDVANAPNGPGPVEHFGFPFCLYDRAKGGLSGFTQAPERGPCNPLPTKAYAGIPGPAVQAKPSVLFGMNVSSDGLAFNNGKNFPRAYDNDLFVAEWGTAGTRGHKVVRVRYDKAGTVASVNDFMSGVLPLDLTFAPDGALWVADMAGQIYRVATIR